MAPSSSKELITPQRVDSILSTLSLPTTKKSLPLEQTTGRILAQDVLADRSYPPFDRVMMDGVAVQYEQWKERMPLEGTQAAGSAAMVQKNQESALSVMTGAPLPKGTDSVIPVEELSYHQSHVNFSSKPHAKGQYIHKKGSDYSQGDILIPKGTLLNATHLAIAASLGALCLEVIEPIRAALITSGNEMIAPHLTPKEYQIRASHPSLLHSLLQHSQLADLHHIHLPDNAQKSALAIQQAQQNYPLLILTGGISKGQFDYIAPSLNEIFGAPLFHGVKQRPGKPFGLWKSDSSIAFALPGNPVSVTATTLRYLIAFLKKQQGLKDQQQALPLSQDFEWSAKLTGILACKEKNGHLTPSPPKNSGDYSALGLIDGFCEISPGKHRKGKLLPYYPI